MLLITIVLLLLKVSTVINFKSDPDSVGHLCPSLFTNSKPGEYRFIHSPFSFSLPANLWREDLSYTMVLRSSTPFYPDFKKQEGPQLTLVL